MTTTTPETEIEKAVESPAEQENESFGTWLRRQRELREISLREIADTSKISLRYLEALENDRFDILPAAVFAKGFLRQYARYVGLDPEEAVNFYMAANGHTQDDKDADPATHHGGGSTPWSYAIIVFIIALVLMAVVWTLIWLNQRATENPGGDPVNPTSTETPAQGHESPATGVDTPTSITTELSAPTDSPPLPRVQSEEAESALPQVTPGFFITLDFRGDCWVRATVDGQVRAARVYTQGESLPLRATQVVDLDLGNAPEVEMEIDGQPIDLDKSNTIQHLHIDLDTVASLAQGGSLVNPDAMNQDTTNPSATNPSATNRGATNRGAVQ